MTTGYPEQLIVTCVPPEGYPDTWSYEIWLKGRWNFITNITKCINPNLCYNDPPALPTDFSVQWNQTTLKPNTVNTTLNYTCARLCRLKFPKKFKSWRYLFVPSSHFLTLQSERFEIVSLGLKAMAQST